MRGHVVVAGIILLSLKGCHGQLGLPTSLGLPTGGVSQRWPFLPIVIDDSYPATWPKNPTLRAYHYQDWRGKMTYLGNLGHVQCSPDGGRCDFRYSCCSGYCHRATCKTLRFEKLCELSLTIRS
eukprot:Protomagalhaensia_wolfi_Nauph_80__128@NODE_1070_length_1759_cov_5_262209_g812_i0_p4_GENE_NODE_1070_length_1759_cov_5_262209_g812_i0NODE_1070_length_1759_cov_5_262209_g812_i0_p4_ORF_typecomplete_len124_score1_22Conotoxin/PF02950_17/0_00037_NODE_1070_length_1759_cov_5_262209_g812_i0575946